MKTNFIKCLKQFLFLLIAVLGTASNHAQNNPNPTGADIGGKNSDSGILHIDFGGSGSQGVPRDKGSTTSISFSSKTNCLFLFPSETGRKNSSGNEEKGNMEEPEYCIYSPCNIINENNSAGVFAFIHDIGGRSQGGRTTSTDGGQFAGDDIDHYDLDAQITAETIVPDHCINLAYLEYRPGIGCEIDPGGRSGRGTSTTTDGDDDDDYDTGGRNSGSGNTGEEIVASSFF